MNVYGKLQLAISYFWFANANTNVAVRINAHIYHVLDHIRLCCYLSQLLAKTHKYSK